VNWLGRLVEGLVVLVLIMVTWTVGPWIETTYFPVYSKFSVVEVKPHIEGLELTLRFTKLRNCDPQGFAWYVGDLGPGKRELPIARSQPYSTVHRPLGTQMTQPLVVRGLRIEDLPQLYAEVYNRCHPLWITRSIIYP
jgi:hypothetical protein